MKKILLIETSPYVNGGQHISLLVSDLLCQTRGYEVFWAIPEEGLLSGELEKRGYRYLCYGKVDLPAGVKGKSVIFKYAGLSVRVISKLLAIIRREKIDVIYAPGPAALPWSAICGALKKRPVVWHLHHLFLDGMTKKLLNVCSKWKSVRRIITVSSAVREQIHVPRGYDKVSVIYNPIDVERFYSGDPSAVLDELPIIRKEQGQTNKIIVAHVALIEEEKRQDFTIKTVHELVRLGYDAHALLVGSARPEMAGYERSLHEQAIECNIENKIHFLGYRKDIADILKACDLLIVPSIEGFPLAGQEACAAGIPLIACDIGGVKELMNKSKAGLGFGFNDEKDAAAKAVEALNERGVFSKNGLEFSKGCTKQVYSEKIKDCFSSLF